MSLSPGTFVGVRFYHNVYKKNFKQMFLTLKPKHGVKKSFIIHIIILLKVKKTYYKFYIQYMVANKMRE